MSSVRSSIDGSDAVTRYALDVLEGRQVAGISERLACQRHLDDLSRSGQMGPELIARVDAVRVGARPRPSEDTGFPWEFDVDQALFVAVEWFGYLRHIKGELAGSDGSLVGKPIVLVPAHVFTVGSLFGWTAKDKSITRSDGRMVGARRFEKAFISEARKNAKTTILAGIALYMMVGDTEPSPDVFCAAVDRTQARELYEASMAMANGSPDISSRLKVNNYRMVHRARGGKFMPFSGQSGNKDSFNPHCIVIDEYHAHRTSEIWDLMSTSLGQRTQALMATITTSGMDVQSPCHQEYEYCKLILAGSIINDKYFVMIRELDDADDEHDPVNWVKANPLRAASERGLEKLKQQHDEAFDSNNPAKIKSFRVKNLNKWVEGNEQSYMGDHMDKWDRLSIPREDFIELTRGCLCLVGVDLSKKIDLTGVGFVIALPNGRVAVCAHGFLPRESLEMHEKTDRIPYSDWVKDKWLTVTEGAVIDYGVVQDFIIAAQRDHQWPIHQICFDPYNATHFATEMANKGFVAVEIRQTMANLNEPTKTFRELVLSGKLVHDGSPLLRWCVSNAEEIVDSKENLMLTKKNSGETKRIDLLAAILDAMRQYNEIKLADMSDFGF